jgi:hypothetical protein
MCQTHVKCEEAGTEIHHSFIDFRAQYDSTDRFKLYFAMEEMQIPENLINLMKVSMRNIKYQIRIQAMLSKPLSTINGVQLGYCCLLFNRAL